MTTNNPNETPLTVAEAMDELREMFPPSGYWELRMTANRNEIRWTIYPTGYSGKRLDGKSLEDVMAQVRAWKENTNDD